MKSEQILQESKFRNICFVGGGNLSKGAKSYKTATLERFSKAYDKEITQSIKELIIGLSKGEKASHDNVRQLVSKLNLIKPRIDELDYQPTGHYQSDLRVIRAFVQRHLPQKYLKIMANYFSGLY